MSDPKMGLTKFSEVYRAKNDPVMAGGGGGPMALRYPGLAGEFAAANIVHETDEQALVDLQAEYSISSVEELVSLARVATRKRKPLLRNLGLDPATVRGISSAFRKSDKGKTEIADWERYRRFEYQSGCELDFTTPPPPPPPLPPAFGFGAGPAGAPAPGAPAPGVVTPILPAVDPPSVNLIDAFMSPIRDQANRGTCVAFTTMACLEYYLHRYRGKPDADLSEQYAYWKMVTDTGQRSLAALMPLIPNGGSCTERVWPYYANPIVGNDGQGPPPPGAVAEAPAFDCETVAQLPAQSVLDIRHTIAVGNLVGIGIPVYSSWYDSEIVRKVGNITVPIPGEVPQRIGHAVTLVGYADDAEYAGGGYFIVRNSWGRNWGTRSVFGPGYGTIPYRYIERHNWDAWNVAS